MRKSVLLIILILSGGCETLPPVPEFVQYGIHADVQPPGFYGVNNKTKARVYRPFDDPAMKGGQCTDAAGYKAGEKYRIILENYFRQRCTCQ